MKDPAEVMKPPKILLSKRCIYMYVNQSKVNGSTQGRQLTSTPTCIYIIHVHVGVDMNFQEQQNGSALQHINVK